MPLRIIDCPQKQTSEHEQWFVNICLEQLQPQPIRPDHKNIVRSESKIASPRARKLNRGKVHRMHIRSYAPSDWNRLCEIHDAARMYELKASGLIEAFLSLERTAESEGLFEAEILVAEDGSEVQGFAAYTKEELTWLYVDPRYYRRGIGRHLVRAVVKASPNPLSLDVLVGNEAALSLYRSEGFSVIKQVSGKLAGNETFPATAYVLRFNGAA